MISCHVETPAEEVLRALEWAKDAVRSAAREGTYPESHCRFVLAGLSAAADLVREQANAIKPLLYEA